MQPLRTPLVLALISLCLFALPARSQDPATAAPQAAHARTGRAAVTVSATADRVRFASPNSVAQLRLEVYDESGRKVFDTEQRGGSVLDWHLQGGDGERAGGGDYAWMLTTKDLSGRISQRVGRVSLRAGAAPQASAAKLSELTARQAEAVGPVEGEEETAVLDESHPAGPSTLLAHDGSEGQLVMTHGDLSFRGGDFFTGRDRELMRLSQDGSLTVEGALLARGGIRFADGTVLDSARGLAARAGKGGKAGALAPGDGGATPSATVNRLAKFSTVGGNVVDSTITEDASGNIAIGTTPTGAAFDLKRSSPADVLQRLWNAGTGGAKLRYVAGTGATSQLQLTDGTGWLMAIAGNRETGLQFRVRGAEPNTEAGLDASTRMTILGNGNVGIGTTTPLTTLHLEKNVPEHLGPVLTLINRGGFGASSAIDFINHNYDVSMNYPAARIEARNNEQFSSRLSFLTKNPAQGSSAPLLERMTITPDGNVGIGVHNPTERLDVVGNLKASGAVNAAQYNTGGLRVFAVTGAMDPAAIPNPGNTFAGVGAGQFNTSDSNSFFGASAGHKNSTGDLNSFFGANAGRNNTSGRFNSSFGVYAGLANSTGGSNSYFGFGAAFEGNGSHNSYFGASAGYFMQGSHNSFFGRDAGINMNGGSGNTMLGYYSNGNSNITLATAIGACAEVTRSNSLVLGKVSGLNDCISSGDASTSTDVGIGTTAPDARLSVVSPDTQVRFGPTAADGGGYLASTGAGQAIVSGGGRRVGSGWVAKAAGASLVEMRDGTVRFFTNGGLTAGSAFAPIQRMIVTSAGDVGINTVSPDAKLHVAGTVKATGVVTITQLGSAGDAHLCRNASNEIASCSSSLRYKENVLGFGRGLDLVRKLRPVSFAWVGGGARDLGFVAEEVAEAEPLLATTNEKGQVEGVKYDRVTAVLVNAVREQQEQIEGQRREIEELKRAVKALASRRR